MTSIEAMKQALEALELSDKLINGDESTMGLDGAMDGYYNGCFDIDGTNKRTNEAITALRQAIEHAEKQEPVGLFSINDYGNWEQNESNYGTPLYFSPLKPEWIGLTDEAIWSEYQVLWPFHPAEEPRLAKDIAKFARAIEAKLKEKNHG